MTAKSRRTVTESDSSLFSGHCTGWECHRQLGDLHGDECDAAYVIPGGPMPCCDGFEDGKRGWMVRTIDTPGSGVQVLFGSWDDSIERMRFCPWCGKRFEVAP